MTEQKVKCEKCGKDNVSEKVEAYSREHFDGHVYCYDCQKIVGDAGTGSWTYKKPEEEQKKAAPEDAVVDVKSTEEDDMDEYDGEFPVELKQKSKELDKKIISLVTEMSRSDTEGFYAWLKTVYGVDDLETLNIEQKEAVLSETEKMVAGKKSEKVVEHENGNKTVEIDEGVFTFQERGKGTLSCSDEKGNVYVLNITVPDCSCSQFQKDKTKRCPHLKAAAVGGFLDSEKEKEKAVEPEIVGSVDKVGQKKIEITWDKIPVQMLVPKLRKALEYACEETAIDGLYHVKSPEGTLYNTSINSCECEDWIRAGSSVNPCKHMIRVKYSDEEIHAKLKELGAEELPEKRKTQKDIAVREPSVGADMMIQGLTPRLAELGKIKIGGKGKTKTKTGYLLPEKWDHFEVATLMKDDEGRLVMDDEINAIIGKDCKSLDISLCYDSIPMNIPTMFSWFSQSKLMCMGNGISASRTMESGDKEEIVCNPKTCEAYLNKRCKPYGRLSVILADSNRIGGVYVFRTTSWNSLRNILSSMSFIKTITGGVLAGLPLTMRLLPMSVIPSGVGRNVKIYVVNIEYSGKISDLKEAAVEEVERRLKLGMNMKQMEEIDRGVVKERVLEEARQEAIDIAEEFAPEGE